ncbi:hypothetical protein ADM98_13730 [Exiguobacterium sp. BMC-KP]|uniref:hypothetical protein n=1 Tax=Exiguobacterium sp. BMC-KP TaxID=1684312 RepID=UPI0006AA1696|nr:hypothetical protein [Exiguobacterium sp. BMC-KP]KOP29898.1 hypothetical protein ADM98_13730 [Exiguobacterium sp. BMC-KP]
MGTSRWMEHELEAAQARILRLTASEQEQLIVELETDQLTGEDVLYRLYIIQPLLLNDRERFETVAERFLNVEGVEQVLALFLYELGERYPMKLALRSASPYLPYGLALRLDEIKQQMSVRKQKSSTVQTSNMTQCPVAPGTELMHVLRHGNWVEQMRCLTGAEFERTPSLMEYITDKYFHAQETAHQSLLVIDQLLGSVLDHLTYPTMIQVPHLDVDWTISSRQDLEEVLLAHQQEQQALLESIHMLQRMDPFRALLVLRSDQLVHLEERELIGSDMENWFSACEELAGLTFETEDAGRVLSPLAQQLYRASHILYPEVIAFEQIYFD